MHREKSGGTFTKMLCGYLWLVESEVVFTFFSLNFSILSGFFFFLFAMSICIPFFFFFNKMIKLLSKEL